MQKSVYIENHETFLQQKNVPVDPFIKLEVNEKFFGSVLGGGTVEGHPEGEDEEQEEPKPDPIERLSELFSMIEY